MCMFCGIYGILEPTEMTKGKNVTLSECASYQIIERSVLKEMLSPVRRCVGVHCSAACGCLCSPGSTLPAPWSPPSPLTPHTVPNGLAWSTPSCVSHRGCRLAFGCSQGPLGEGASAWRRGVLRRVFPGGVRRASSS